MRKLLDSIISLSEDIRYVAIYSDGELISTSKPGLTNESSSESDKYEELIVNPTLLKLVTQRGNIDCGGVRFVIIRYGNFYQYICPIKSGHISVAMDLNANPVTYIESINNLIIGSGLQS
jgi:hypothetical protein